MAKQPGSAKLMMSGRYASWCRSVPSAWTAPPNRPHWTPALTISERSVKASISIAVTEPPASPSPPYSLGKPRVTRPDSAIFAAMRVTRARASRTFSP